MSGIKYIKVDDKLFSKSKENNEFIIRRENGRKFNNYYLSNIYNRIYMKQYLQGIAEEPYVTISNGDMYPYYWLQTQNKLVRNYLMNPVTGKELLVLDINKKLDYCTYLKETEDFITFDKWPMNSVNYPYEPGFNYSYNSYGLNPIGKVTYQYPETNLPPELNYYLDISNGKFVNRIPSTAKLQNYDRLYDYSYTTNSNICGIAGRILNPNSAYQGDKYKTIFSLGRAVYLDDGGHWYIACDNLYGELGIGFGFANYSSDDASYKPPTVVFAEYELAENAIGVKTLYREKNPLTMTTDGVDNIVYLYTPPTTYNSSYADFPKTADVDDVYSMLGSQPYRLKEVLKKQHWKKFYYYTDGKWLVVDTACKHAYELNQKIYKMDEKYIVYVKKLNNTFAPIYVDDLNKIRLSIKYKKDNVENLVFSSPLNVITPYILGNVDACITPNLKILYRGKHYFINQYIINSFNMAIFTLSEEELFDISNIDKPFFFNQPSRTISKDAADIEEYSVILENRKICTLKELIDIDIHIYDVQQNSISYKEILWGMNYYTGYLYSKSYYGHETYGNVYYFLKLNLKIDNIYFEPDINSTKHSWENFIYDGTSVYYNKTFKETYKFVEYKSIINKLLGLDTNGNKKQGAMLYPFKNEDIADIKFGRDFSLWLLKDGSLWSAGSNLYGQLGIHEYTTNEDKLYDITHDLEPFVKKIDLYSIIAIDVCDYGWIALSSEHILYACGKNTTYRFGEIDGTNRDIFIPKAIADNVVDADITKGNLIYRKMDGTAYAMGYNFDDRLNLKIAEYIGYVMSPVKVEVDV